MTATLKLVCGLALALPPTVTARAQQACEAIAEQARSYKPPTDGRFLFPLQGMDQMQGSVVHLGQRQDPRMQEPSRLIDILRTRFRPTSELLNAAQVLNSPAGMEPCGKRGGVCTPSKSRVEPRTAPTSCSSPRIRAPRRRSLTRRLPPIAPGKDRCIYAAAWAAKALSAR